MLSNIKKHDAIKYGMYVCGKRTEVTLDDYSRKKRTTKKSLVIMIKGSGEAKDIIRHIRNGIAHGRVVLCTRNGTRCIELKDYGKSRQTAYMLIPVDFVYNLYTIYFYLRKHLTK